MHENEFRAGLAKDGFSEVALKTTPANVHNHAHAHEFEVRGLVLAGELTLSWQGKQNTYRAGEVFTMAAGCEHTEQFGPQGATTLAGRKHHQHA